jgi:hypothetical protein
MLEYNTQYCQHATQHGRLLLFLLALQYTAHLAFWTLRHEALRIIFGVLYFTASENGNRLIILADLWNLGTRRPMWLHRPGLV